MDELDREVVDIEAKACANMHGLDTERVCKVFHRLDKIEWHGPNFPWSTAFDEALRFLGPKKALEIFETSNLRNLCEKVWIVAYLNDGFTPFYTLHELAALIVDFCKHLENNREYLLRTGHPRITFGRSFWLDKCLNKLLYLKVPIFGPIVDTVLNSGLVDPNDWKNMGSLDSNFTKIRQGENGNLVYDYVWAKNPEAVRSEPVEVGDGTLFIRFAFLAPGDQQRLCCSYDEAGILPGLSPNDAERVESLRPKFFDLKMKVLHLLGELVANRNPWRLWDECLCLFAEALTTEEADFLLNLDNLHAKLAVGGTYNRSRKGPALVYRNGGLSDLFDFIGHCEKELKFGSLRRTKEAFLQIPQSLYSSWVSSYYEVAAESWQMWFDEVLEKFLLWEAEERGFWEEYRNRTNDALDRGFTGKVPVSVTVWVDRNHKNIYEPSIRMYADFQKTQLETTGQLAKLNLSVGGSGNSGFGWMNARALAEKHGLNPEVLRKRLDRLRAKHPLDTDFFVESQDRGMNKPKFLYNEQKVMRIIESIKKKQASARRPSGKK